MLVHVTTVPETLGFLRGQVGYMRDRGFDVQAMTSPGVYLEIFRDREGVAVHSVTMPRRITPAQDLKAIFQLWRVLRRLRPTVVHSHTPKGGLLGMISAALAGVPLRIYHVHGLPMVTATGYKRALLRWSEWVSCRLAHEVLSVSRSCRDIAVEENICPASKIKVILSGSSNGVDAEERFNPAKVEEGARAALRARMGVPEDALLLGFVGRIVRDKGLIELGEAWKILAPEYPKLHLMVIGSFEPQDPIPPETERILREDPRIHIEGQDWNITPYYAATDIVVLPTYREGLNTVCMESGAMALPVVSTAVPGCIDAIRDGETGILVPPRDGQALAEAIRRYIEDPGLRRRHGQAGREHVRREFNQERLWEALYQEYLRLLQERRLPLPEAETASRDKRRESVR